MTAKILAVLGAIGILATIWTTDWRYFWTGALLLIISIVIAATQDAKRKDPRGTWAAEIRQLRAENNQISKATRDALKIFEGLGIEEPAPWISKAATLAAVNATEDEVNAYAQISAQGALVDHDLDNLRRVGITVHINEK